MKISPIVNNYNLFLNKNRSKRSKISFGQNDTDIFIKKSESFNKEELLKTLNGDFRKLNKSFFQNLSEEEYQFCLDWAMSDEKKFSGMVQFSPKAVLPEDVKDIVKYTDYYYSGLQKITYTAGKDMSQVLVAGIGQSPVAAVKLLELSGLNTAYCPISGLTTFNEPVEKYVTEKNIDKYFSYWSNFGFSIDDLFSDKLVIFTDHKETGRTFEVFKEIINKIIDIKKAKMKKIGKKPAKIKFLSLRSIYKLARKDAEEKKWGDDFEDSVYHTSYMKTLYSPLFKLPLPNISEIAQRHEYAKTSDRSLRFNKLSVLMYDELYRKRIQIPKRMFSNLDKDRQFRLAFYNPEKDKL